MPATSVRDNTPGDVLYLDVYELSSILLFNDAKKTSTTTAGSFIITIAKSIALTASIFYSLAMFNSD